jgi:hypothetical protein
MLFWTRGSEKADPHRVRDDGPNASGLRLPEQGSLAPPYTTHNARIWSKCPRNSKTLDNSAVIATTVIVFPED